MSSVQRNVYSNVYSEKVMVVVLDHSTKKLLLEYLTIISVSNIIALFYHFNFLERIFSS